MLPSKMSNKELADWVANENERNSEMLNEVEDRIRAIDNMIPRPITELDKAQQVTNDIQQMSNDQLASLLDRSRGDHYYNLTPFITSNRLVDIAVDEIARRLRALPGMPPDVKVVNDVLDELHKAVGKFPSWPIDPFHALAIIGEEFGELQQSFLKAHYEGANGPERLEAVQLAAMAIRFLFHWNDYDVPKCYTTERDLGLEGGG